MQIASGTASPCTRKSELSAKGDSFADCSFCRRRGPSIGLWQVDCGIRWPLWGSEGVFVCIFASVSKSGNIRKRMSLRMISVVFFLRCSIRCAQLFLTPTRNSGSQPTTALLHPMLLLSFAILVLSVTITRLLDGSSSGFRMEDFEIKRLILPPSTLGGGRAWVFMQCSMFRCYLCVRILILSARVRCRLLGQVIAGAQCMTPG